MCSLIILVSKFFFLFFSEHIKRTNPLKFWSSSIQYGLLCFFALFLSYTYTNIKSLYTWGCFQRALHSRSCWVEGNDKRSICMHSSMPQRWNSHTFIILSIREAYSISNTIREAETNRCERLSAATEAIVLNIYRGGGARFIFINSMQAHILYTVAHILTPNSSPSQMNRMDGWTDRQQRCDGLGHGLLTFL